MKLPDLVRGDVVLTRFPFTDLTGSSLRPAVVISSGSIGEDVILVAVSSVVRGPTSPFDCNVDTGHSEFAGTGLRVSSVIRTHKVVTVERGLITRKLGHIGPQLQSEMDALLRAVLSL